MIKSKNKYHILIDSGKRKYLAAPYQHYLEQNYWLVAVSPTADYRIKPTYLMIECVNSYDAAKIAVQRYIDRHEVFDEPVLTEMKEEEKNDIKKRNPRRANKPIKKVRKPGRKN